MQPPVIPIPTPLPIPPMPDGGIDLMDDILTIENMERVISAAQSVIILVAQWHNLLLAVTIVALVVVAIRWLRALTARTDRVSEV